MFSPTFIVEGGRNITPPVLGGVTGMSSSLEGALEEVWARGRRHVKISKLYLTGLLKRGPNIFVALAWSQVSLSCYPVVLCGLLRSRVQRVQLQIRPQILDY